MGEVLFHPILLQKVQTHFRSMGACAIGMDDHISFGLTDLSLPHFANRINTSGMQWPVLNLTPFEGMMITWKPLGFQKIVNINFCD
jgi:hypothetical protein